MMCLLRLYKYVCVDSQSLRSWCLKTLIKKKKVTRLLSFNFMSYPRGFFSSKTKKVDSQLFKAQVGLSSWEVVVEGDNLGLSSFWF